jgi:hypothetical protein
MSNACCSRTIDDFMYSIQIHSLIFLASTTDAMYLATFFSPSTAEEFGLLGRQCTTSLTSREST